MPELEEENASVCFLLREKNLRNRSHFIALILIRGKYKSRAVVARNHVLVLQSWLGVLAAMNSVPS